MNKNLTNFLLINLSLFFFIYSFSTSIQTEEFIRVSLAGKYNNEIITNHLENNRKWSWVGYLLTPLIILIRTSLIAFLMQMAVFLFDSEDETSFGKYWGVSLSAEWVMVGLVAFRFFYFSAINTNYTIEDLQNFIPGSLTNIYDVSHLDSWLAYPFNLLSIWELLYWVILILGIQEIFKTTFFKSFGIVLASYGVGLLIWVGFVMYMLLTNFN